MKVTINFDSGENIDLSKQEFDKLYGLFTKENVPVNNIYHENKRIEDEKLSTHIFDNILISLKTKPEITYVHHMEV
jgi:hypothetical protein